MASKASVKVSGFDPSAFDGSKPADAPAAPKTAGDKQPAPAANLFAIRLFAERGGYTPPKDRIYLLGKAETFDRKPEYGTVAMVPADIVKRFDAAMVALLGKADSFVGLVECHKSADGATVTIVVNGPDATGSDDLLLTAASGADALSALANACDVLDILARDGKADAAYAAKTWPDVAPDGDNPGKDRSAIRKGYCGYCDSIRAEHARAVRRIRAYLAA